MTRRPLPSATVTVLLALLVLGGVTGCREMAPAGFSGDVDVLLARGAALADFTSRQPADALSDADVLVLGYLERLRLGLGSPFRLIEFALRDQAIPRERREALAFALLSDALHGHSYEVEPSVLDFVHFPRVQSGATVGVQQLRLIEQIVDAAPTATSGERAVRLGYRLAEAERTISFVPFSVVAHVAAMVADRRRAREDARMLLRAASRRSVSPLDLLPEWRVDLRFLVESPALLPRAVHEEAWEAREGPQVALALRTLAQRLRSRTTLVTEPRDAYGRESRPSLSLPAAERLRALAEERNYPAQAPIAVALSIRREALLGGAGMTGTERSASESFLERSWNEERLAAEAPILRAAAASRERQLSLVLLQAAVFFRVWNQEEPWFPGDPAPADRDVAARFGLAGIDFDRDVPMEWRPFYLRVVARGLADLQRVLPTASVRGLRIRVGELPAGISALALHDPGTRTLVLPVRTGAGTLAHEIAHDLDWQLARKRYDRRGYATDLSVRRQRSDRIATSVTALAASLVPPRQDSLARPHDVRPAEVFARGADWLIAAMLARQGRTGGYLTSFQDAAITGYGTTRGPDIGGAAVPSLLAILDAVAPVGDSSRTWAAERFGPTRTLSPMEISQAILDSQGRAGTLDPVSRIDLARKRSLTSLRDPSCRLGSAQGLRRLVDAQRVLIQASARAALRGSAVDEIHSIAERSLGAAVRPRVDGWLSRRLYGAPEPTDSMIDAFSSSFEDILYRAEAMVGAEPAEVGSPFQLGAPSTVCGSNPFAAPATPAPRPATTAPRPNPMLAVPTQWQRHDRIRAARRSYLSE